MPSLDTLNSETIASDFEVAEEEIKKVKKIFNLDAANADLKKRQDILKKTDDGITGLFNSIRPTILACASPSQRTRRRLLPRRSRLLRRNWKFLEDSSPLLERSRSLLLLSLPLIIPSRLLMDGRMLPLLSSLTSRKLQETCFQRTESPEPWTSRRTLLPSLRSSRLMLRQSSTFFPRETRFLLMLRPSRTS